jgi:hypothetical protein
VPVVPVLQPFAADGQFLHAAGIPTYGIAPILVDLALGNFHNPDEHVGARSLLEGRGVLLRLVTIDADQLWRRVPRPAGVRPRTVGPAPPLIVIDISEMFHKSLLLLISYFGIQTAAACLQAPLRT